MNQLEKRRYEAEDEIDIFELLDILIKRKLLIAIVFVLCTLGGLGAALLVRNSKEYTLAQQFSINYPQLESNYYFTKSGLVLNKVNISNLLMTNKYIDEFFSVKELNEFYEATVPMELRNNHAKSKFLNRVIEVTYNKERNNYIIKAKMKKNEELQEKLIEKYFSILKIAVDEGLDQSLEEQYTFIKKENELSRKKLIEIEENVKTIINKNIDRITKEINIVDFLKFENPILSVEKDRVTEVFNQSSSMLIGLEGLKKDENIRNLVRSDSSIYLIEGKSKAKLVLGIGMLLGIVLGIMGAFVAEFIANYKKSRHI